MTRLMKGSGILWAGEIPEHWRVVRLKECFVENNRRQPCRTVLSLSYGKIIKKDLAEKKGVTPESFDSYQGVHPADVVLRLTDLQNDQKSLRVGYADMHGIITSAYLSVHGKGLHPRFSAYLLHDIGDIQKVFYGLGGGVRQSMKFTDLAEILVPQLPRDEQSRIAAWLDLQTQRIDKRRELLGKKRELLRELRSNLISETLASGLRGQEKAATGLSDIPELPLGWKASHAKRLLRFITSGSRGWAEYYADEGDFFLRIGNLTRETIELELSDVQHVALPSKAAEGRRTRIREGDMLVSITADLGSIAIAPKLAKAAYVNQHIALCRPKDSVHPRWLGYAMLSSQSKRQMMSSGYGGTKVQLSLDDVRNVWLAVPPLDEQEEIATFLDGKLSQIDRQIALINQLDDLLKQQRKAIIHEAVTGKIDLSGGPVGDNLSPTEVVRPPFMRQDFDHAKPDPEQTH